MSKEKLRGMRAIHLESERRGLIGLTVVKIRQEVTAAAKNGFAHAEYADVSQDILEDVIKRVQADFPDCKVGSEKKRGQYNDRISNHVFVDWV